MYQRKTWKMQSTQFSLYEHTLKQSFNEISSWSQQSTPEFVSLCLPYLLPEALKSGFWYNSNSGTCQSQPGCVMDMIRQEAGKCAIKHTTKSKLHFIVVIYTVWTEFVYTKAKVMVPSWSLAVCSYPDNLQYGNHE